MKSCPRCGYTYGCSCSDRQIARWAEEQEPFIQIETPAHDEAAQYIKERKERKP